MKIAFVGGTGPAGIGLCARLARAGHEVALGSRSAERAAEAVHKVLDIIGTGSVSGGTNEEVIAGAEVVFLTAKAEAQPEAVRGLGRLLDRKIVVSMANPITVAEGKAVYRAPPAGSLAEEAQTDAPSARVVGALHEIRVSRFANLERQIDSDTIVTGDDEAAKQTIMGLCRDAGVRPVDGGPLFNSRYVEAYVAVLITVNFRYKAGVSIRLTGLPKS